MLNHQVQKSDVSEGQTSAALWRLSWQGWMFMGIILREEEEGENRESVKHEEGEEARGPDIPYLLSFLVRAQVWTIMRMLVDVTSGLQGTKAWVWPDPGGWHRGVKSDNVMGRRAPHSWVAMGKTKNHCERLGFSVGCQTSNYNKLF